MDGCMDMYQCMYVCMRACGHVCLCVCVCMCVCVCVCVVAGLGFRLFGPIFRFDAERTQGRHITDRTLPTGQVVEYRRYETTHSLRLPLSLRAARSAVFALSFAPRHSLGRVRTAAGFARVAALPRRCYRWLYTRCHRGFRVVVICEYCVFSLSPLFCSLSPATSQSLLSLS